MAPSLTSLMTSLKSGFQNNSGSIRNTTIALLVFGLNEDFGTLFLDAASLQRRKDKERNASVVVFIRAGVARDYYICAVLGGTKEAKLINATAEEKLQIETDYANAGNISQTAAIVLLGGALITALVAISVQRCCFQQEIGSLPSPYAYQKLESEAAVDAFKENMEKLAQGQGKRRADLYFATMHQTNPSDILKNAYQNLVTVNKFDEAFPSLEDYQHLQAQAAVTAFKERVQQEGKQKVELTFVDTTWREYEASDAFSLVNSAYEAMVDRYPRSTGDRSQPYVKESKDGKDAGSRDNIPAEVSMEMN
ncbi:cation channel [Desmophyllum pertusum]|uniref:Cation channel n=1 Tax=Desmophyllum pertusum TaxID=174260 RepID=A0A9W9Y8P8_9CNID|nr:cation channel [Desmophyllum pertusum]